MTHLVDTFLDKSKIFQVSLRRRVSACSHITSCGFKGNFKILKRKFSIFNLFEELEPINLEISSSLNATATLRENRATTAAASIFRGEEILATTTLHADAMLINHAHESDRSY